MPLEQTYGQEQKQVQKLAMTQQMQQSIQILRYSIEDLHVFLSQKQLDNPFIKISDRMNYAGKLINTTNSIEDKGDWISQTAEHKQQSLYDYLLSQVHLTMRKSVLRGWVVFLIDHLDTNGYLSVDFAEILKKTKVDETTLLDALTLLQRLDPPGIGARNLQECLLLQIENSDNVPKFAYEIVDEAFLQLADRKWTEIARRFAISLEEIQKVFDYVRTLSPAPGAAFGQDDIGYVYPDLLVKVDKNQQKVELKITKQSKPLVVFKQDYFAEFSQLPDKDVKDYLREKKADYLNIAQNLERRGSTIERVGQAIINHQANFFLKGDHPLSPLLLREIAHELHLHESTVSRAVNGKYLKCDFGVFELRHFFTKTVNSNREDEELTADAVQSQIKALIDAEDKVKPLSDSKIEKQLSQNGIEISRRTIAKYRDSIGIPSSSKRKRFDEKSKK
ncbi:RNA polymerase factor sigma-54 [Liquorilactobacillus aquaticus DSM 21051]|uniref:RNA polymerase factor sigma-54 n=1 Tax=Liquorilactobacillus aquaticus DSM 21051 TaxID=1423725 RepID=A0A0R2CVQ9_9LACO|nr:RNA polymerase factor sigma-54 [Liquorilactobacillus aquaticus]KRM95848.1 RNA polymerase factor sigma-54 [Liquorilactobacillus aquaticus DSM 21051]